MSLQDELKAAIKAVLPDVAGVIGWGPGPDALQQAPLVMRSENDVENFEAGFFSVQNTAVFLPEYKGKKVGVVVKGCDSRSIGQQLAEGLVKREELVIIGYPCAGVVDHAKLSAKFEDKAEPGEVTSVVDNGDTVTVTFDSFSETYPKDEVLAGKCLYCQHPNSLIADTFVGEKREATPEKDPFADLEAFEAQPLEDRMAFWEKEMSRCIRCYACRNACPLCVCRDQCIATSRDPEWVTQADSVKDKLFFQVIHAVHLAGRCTGCGECQRACPMNIPVGLLKRTLGKKVHALFGYQAGVDPQATPPLMEFQIEENRIKEREW